MSFQSCHSDSFYCNYSCRYNNYGKDFPDLHSIFLFCCGENYMNNENYDYCGSCTSYYLDMNLKCSLLPSTPSDSSSFWDSDSVGSGISVCPDNKIEFIWRDAEHGFIESFPVFVSIFAVYCIVKVMNFAFNGGAK